MANSNGWGDGAANNAIGWGQGANNAIGWGSTHATSWAGLTNISGAPTTDPDAQAFITAAAITDPTQQAAINTLVVDLKGYSIWSKMKALYPFVGSTASQQKFNLKDPRDLDVAFRLVFSGGITHSSNGVDPNGVNATADTKITSASLGTSSLSMWYYSRENIGTNSLIGNANKLFFTPILTANSNAYYALNSDFQGGTATFIPSNFSGLLGLNRTGTSNFKAFRNGASYKTLASVTGAGTEAGNITLFQRNGVGQYTANQCAFASIGDGLTDTEAANFYTAVQAFQTALNRNV
jgi:hypothetical protein